MNEHCVYCETPLTNDTCGCDGETIEILSAMVDELVTMLKISREAIESLEVDSFGIGSADGGYTHWWIRDELLSNIGLTLAKVERMKG